MDKEFKELVEEYKDRLPHLNLDPDLFGQNDLKAMNALDLIGKTKTIYEFNETEQTSPVKKVSGLEDFRLINDPVKPDKEERVLLAAKDYVIAGTKMNIKDIISIKNTESSSN